MKCFFTQFLLLAGLPLMASMASCISNPSGEPDTKHILDINELVVLRTEGLVLAEIAAQQTRDGHVHRMIRNIQAYYQETHPEFLQLCRGQPIVLGADDFDMIWNALYEQVYAGGRCSDEAFLALYHANTTKLIALYEQLQDSGKKDARRFALRALPGLYNQQRELGAIIRHKAKYTETAK